MNKIKYKLGIGVFLISGIAIFVICIGLFFLFIVGGYNYNKEDMVEIKATIVEIKKTKKVENDFDETTVTIDHDVYIDYEYEGVSYTHKKLNGYSNSYKEGKEIEVLIDKTNPNYATVDSPGTKVFAIIAICIIFPLAGIGMFFQFFKGLNKFIKEKKLITTGSKVTAKIVHHSHKYDNDYYDGYPIGYIMCEYDGRKYSSYKFHAYKEIKDGDDIALYLDYNDKDRYFVDVENYFLEKAYRR